MTEIGDMVPPLLTVRARRVLMAVTLLGVAAWAGGLLVDATRAWSALIVNMLFWSGLGHAGVAFAAVFHLTSARWARAVARMAEATVAFLPVSALMLIVLLSGVSAWAPWMHDPNPARRLWLNAPFFIGRQAIAFLVLSAVSLAYVRASIRPDIGQLREQGQAVESWLARVCLGGWRGREEERQRSRSWQGRLAPAVLIAYACVLSLQAFDFVMSLDPHWYSSLAGGYVFVGSLYTAVAFLAIALGWIGSRPGFRGSVGVDQAYDVGRMLLGFCMLWAYLFWAQYLVIWYGDLPEETAFVAHRTVDAPWAGLSWVVLAMAFVIPFVTLLSRDVKRHARGLGAVAIVALTGMWLERFILVAPSLWTGDRLPLGVVEVLVTAGVGALFVLSWTAFLERVPMLPRGDSSPREDRLPPEPDSSIIPPS